MRRRGLPNGVKGALRAGAAFLVVAGLVGVPVTTGTAATTDALQRRTQAQLASFTNWLAAGGQAGHGYIGEVGWPADDSRWAALATAWYRQADQAWLWTSAWAAGEWWPSTYPLAIYSADGNQLTGPRPQAAIVEAQAYRKRSVNMAGAEFGAPSPTQAMSTTFSSNRPGAVGVDYRWPNPSSFTYLAARGITTVRVPFRWERIQPSVGGPLALAELMRLTSTIDAAHAAGIEVILDLHNYGAYWAADQWGTGWRKPLSLTGWLRADHLADVWRRLSEALAGRPGLIGYGIMNEPVSMPGGAATWERASQLAVSAIRSRGDPTNVMVAGYNWSGPASFAQEHPGGPWIVDPAGHTFYEAHHYFDCDGSGKYASGYDATVSCAASQGW